jgi:NADH-quinone oxidoreductase subunit D
MLRGSGFNWDLRKANPFTSIYNYLNFKVPVGQVGDCFDRFLIRVEEIKQSVKILEYCIGIFPLVKKIFIRISN